MNTFSFESATGLDALPCARNLDTNTGRGKVGINRAVCLDDALIILIQKPGLKELTYASHSKLSFPWSTQRMGSLECGHSRRETGLFWKITSQSKQCVRDALTI